MNGTQEIEVCSILEGTHNGIGNYYLRHKVTKSYLSVFFDTKEEAEKVLNSWRYADKMIDFLEYIVENDDSGDFSYLAEHLLSKVK